MLKDIRELGNDLQKYFFEITFWPELKFNRADMAQLAAIEHVKDVGSHSITLQVDRNHCIIPSQYILYAVFMKEFACALRDHLDVFEKFKHGKPANQIGQEIYSGSYNLDLLNLDDWSKTIALKPIIDREYNFNAKSIINGTEGNYSIRGTSDFFTSVVLKIINVPDASSSALGKIIYSLTGNRDLYSYLEKRFYNKLPFLIKEQTTNRFAYKVFSFLLQYDNLSKLNKSIQINTDQRFKSVKTENASLTSIFKISSSLQSNEDLSMGGIPRFFSNPIHVDNGQIHYFSTEWTAGTNRRLDIDSLKTIIREFYPEFTIVRENGYLSFKAIDAPIGKVHKKNSPFEMIKLSNTIKSCNLSYNSQLLLRFTTSLLTKPFVILTGLSGSGKTKLAQTFVQWICAYENQYKIIPVGADWTNREPLLGYPNGLEDKKYVLPDSGALQLVMEASEPQNSDKPYFMILDEMNLSHVEYYFADFLSIMESRDKIKLYSGDPRKGSGGEDVKKEIGWPENLFIIGTVNIDETTYMFSPKVLDRANVIEFRIEPSEMQDFLEKNNHLDMDALFIEGDKDNGGLGQHMAADFLALANKHDVEHAADLETLNSFFKELQDVGAEFGYRSASEIRRLIHQLGVLDNDMEDKDKIDIAIMQKLLPKLHGSRKKLVGPLETLAGLCLDKKTYAHKNISARAAYRQRNENNKNNGDNDVIYRISFAKIERMIKNAIDNGFTSYAEA